jgi:hypothetical protein
MSYGTIKVDTITFTDNSVDKSVSLSGLIQNPTFTGNITVTGTISGDVIRGGTTVSGATVTGTTANFVSGVFTTQISGATVTGTTASFTSGVFTNISGTAATITSGIIASGTAAAPSLAILADLDTGLFSPGANQLAVATNGTGRLFVDASGNVGIGASPSSLLWVRGGAATATISSSTNTSNLDITNNTQTTRLGAINADFSIAHAGSERLRITSTGLVGIGTSTPDALFEASVNSSSIAYPVHITNSVNYGWGVGLKFRQRITSGGSLVDSAAVTSNWISDNNSDLKFATTASGTLGTRLTITPAGNVGIGTTSPGARLNIAEGNANAVSTTSTDVNRVLLTDTSGSTSAGVGYSLDFEGAYGGLGRIAISKSNSATAGTSRDTGAFRLFLNQNLGQDSYAAFTEALTIDSGGTDQGLIYRFRGTEQIRVDNSGRLLVGTSTSASTGTSQYALLQVQGWAGASTGEGIFSLQRGESSSAMSSNDPIGDVLFSDKDGGNYAKISAFADAAPAAGDHPGRLVFSTTADGASTPTERLRITSAGLVGIGTSAPADILHIGGSSNQQIRVNGSGAPIYIGSANSILNLAVNRRTSDGAIPDATKSAAYINLDGSGSSSEISFLTASAINTQPTVKAVIDGSGRVGIGTTSPGELLSVNGNVSITSTNRIKTSDSGGNLTIQGGATFPGGHIILNGGNGSDNIIFNRSGTSASTVETARIDSSGRLLVGTSTSRGVATGAEGAIQIERAGVATSSLITNSNDASGAYFNICKTRGTATGSNTIVQSGDEIGGVWFAGGDGSATKWAGSINCQVDGTPGANDMPGRLVFSTTADGAATPTERLRITSAGLVGIGTTGPSYALDVKEIGTGDNIILNLRGRSSDNQAYIRFASNDNATANALIGVPAANTLNIFTNNTERARIDSSGRLLVGTSSTSSVSLLLVQGNSSSSTGGAVVSLQRGATSPTSGSLLGEIRFGDSSSNNGAYITGEADGAWTSGSSQPTRLTFFTAAAGSSSPTERMRIRNGGNVSTFCSNSADSLYLVSAEAAGTSRYFIVANHSGTNVDNGTSSFLLYTNGNVVNTNNSYGAISDAKLKENIVDASSQWDDLKALQVRKYNFKEVQTHTQIGLVAQEVELVSPGLVSESPDRDEDGNDLGTVTKSVNYSVLYMKAVKALQEAMERIETLEGMVAVNNITIDEQQHQLSTLAARLTALESA